MTGHSFGGMTAVYATAEDERIKALFTMDAWLWCKIDEIKESKLVIK